MGNGITLGTVLTAPGLKFKSMSFPGIYTIYIKPALEIIALVGINLIPSLINLHDVNLAPSVLLFP